MGAIKTGICSFGLSGKVFHAPFIQAHPGFELAGIVERHKNESQIKYPQTKLFRSVEELCAEKEIDLIIVNTPGYLHYDHAKAALSSGKNILVEKPFTISVQEGKELIESAAKKNLKITVYQNHRYDGDYLSVKNIIEQRLLGDIKYLEINHERFRPHYGGKAHKEGSLQGAGNMFDISPHLIDQALQFFGWPQAIFADIWKMRNDVMAPDYFKLTLYYKNLRVYLSASSLSREPSWGYILHGTKGSFLQKRSDLQEIQLMAGAIPSLDSWCKTSGSPDGLLHTEINGEEIIRETTMVPGNYMNLFEDLYNFLNGKGKNPVLPEDGLKTIQIIEAAFQSAKERKIVSL